MTGDAAPAQSIRSATSGEDYAAFAALVDGYVAWCRGRYRHDAWFVDQVFGHQGLAEELRQLPALYGPPRGRALLALQGGEVCGGGAYRALGDGVCEMKRLFVPDQFKGLGIGRRLSLALIAAARADGYHLMRLDTGKLLAEAISLYQSVGFRDCPAYHEYPARILPYLVFMELPLTD